MSYSPSSGDLGQPVPNSNLALISLIAGILGISFFPVVGSIIAVITGQMAKNEIRESAGTLGGEGLAQAGVILGWIGIALGVIGLCVFGVLFAIPFCAAILFGISESSFSLMIPTALALL
jgi:hypothetical protein